MLVLSRKCGQSVYIGQDITITILRVRGQMTKIGIDAPSLLRILRGELRADGSSKEPADTRGRNDFVALSADC